MDFIILFCIKQLIIIMEEDILNYSPTVMFRGTPCIKTKIRNLCIPSRPQMRDVAIIILHVCLLQRIMMRGLLTHSRVQDRQLVMVLDFSEI